jgi:hypothetical protein
MLTLVPSTILLRIALAVIARRIARPTAATPSLTFRMAFRAHLVAALCAMAAPACASPFNPSNPAASGYALTFNGTFGGPNGIDINGTRAPGYNWYYAETGAIPAGDVSVDSNGILTLNASASDIPKLYSLPQPPLTIRRVMLGMSGEVAGTSRPASPSIPPR